MSVPYRRNGINVCNASSIGLDSSSLFCFCFVIPPLPPAEAYPSIRLLSSSRPTGLSFSLSLGRSPRYMDRRKSPSSLSYQQARSLTRAQPSSCALVTYEGAGGQPKCRPRQSRAMARVDRAGTRREPLAWGTRRKSIILNHGVIGSNDRTTACRASFHGGSRGRAALSFVTSRRKDPASLSTTSNSPHLGLPLPVLFFEQNLLERRCSTIFSKARLWNERKSEEFQRISMFISWSEVKELLGQLLFFFIFSGERNLYKNI